jgi:hypothetical protein
MKKDLKKKVIKHLKEDTKEFKGQIKDDVKLKKEIKNSASCAAMTMHKKK